MTQYNTLNTKLSNSQLTKLNSGSKNANEVTLKISSNKVILMMIIIFHINCYLLIQKFRGFVTLLQMVQKLI